MHEEVVMIRAAIVCALVFGCSGRVAKTGTGDGHGSRGTDADAAADADADAAAAAAAAPPPDDRRLARIPTKASICDAQHIDFCVGLGVRELEGTFCMSLAYELIDSDVPAERAEALAIFEAACGTGDGAACQQRSDRARTKAEGAPWLVKACNLDDEDGCMKLARLYLYDEYPGVDAKASTRALEKMCERTWPIGCEFAGQRHFEGKGAPKSRDESRRWLVKACQAGGEHVCEALQRP